MVPPPLANHLPLLQGALRAQREVTLSACRPAAVATGMVLAAAPEGASAPEPAGLSAVSKSAMESP